MTKLRTNTGMTGKPLNKIDRFKRFIKMTNLNKENQFDKHILNVVKKMYGSDKNTLKTFFNTFNFTVEKIEDIRENSRLKYDKFFVSSDYYGFGTTFKMKNGVITY